MLQSYETLITKINEWQEAILELEKLSEEFLNSGDRKVKERIDNQNNKIEKQSKEYLDLAYRELPNEQELFWPEKEALESLLREFNKTWKIFKKGGTVAYNSQLIIENKHVTVMKLLILDLSFPYSINLSVFGSLKNFISHHCDLKIFPKMPRSIEVIYVNYNPNLIMPESLTKLQNLRHLHAAECNLKILPPIYRSIKKLHIQNNNFSNKEKRRIKKEYPNAEIYF